MKEIQAPSHIWGDSPWVFLAGSIEMGTAYDWQAILVKMFEDLEGTVLNPRRDDWDSSWVQSINNPQFRDQVEWELAALEQADYIFLNFVPETKSPISLLEVGLFAQHQGLIVCCPDEFWRKGNVDIVCHRYGIRQVKDLGGFYQFLEKKTCPAPKRPKPIYRWGSSNRIKEKKVND